MNLATYWLNLAAEASAVRWGRRFVSSSLRDWRLDHLIESAEVVVSELLTNSVRATGTTDPNPGALVRETLPVVAVRVRVHGQTVLVEVWDKSRAMPRMRAASDDAEGGRGLPLVDQLSQRWGVWLPPTGGKVVYAQLPIAQAPAPVAATAPEPEPPPTSVSEERPLRVIADGAALTQFLTGPAAP